MAAAMKAQTAFTVPECVMRIITAGMMYSGGGEDKQVLEMAVPYATRSKSYPP